VAVRHRNSAPVNVYAVTMLLQFVIATGMAFQEFDAGLLIAFLVTAFSMVLRWRFSIKPLWMLLDSAIMMVLIIFTPPWAPCVQPYVLYFAYHGHFVEAIALTAFIVAVKPQLGLLVLLQSLVPATLLYLWDRDSKLLRAEGDRMRQIIHRMEATEAHLLSDAQDTQRLSRLAERQHIAEILHDNLGHELTGAHLTVKAIGTLLEHNEVDQARQYQFKAEQRLESALRQLKTTVSRIQPRQESDVELVKSLLADSIVPAKFTVQGDTSAIAPFHWQLILACIKESMTNIAKHADATFVTVSLEATTAITRIVIENDGVRDDRGTDIGNGLRYMRKRIEAVNGSVSTSKGDTFTVIVIIPLKGGRTA